MAKILNKQLRKNRVRSTVSGTSERPRLSVFISNMHINAQIIDDSTGKTLASATTVGKSLITAGADGKGTPNMTAKAAMIGREIATKAKKAKVKAVAFDRNGRAYAGRLKALADAARKEGLEF